LDWIQSRGESPENSGKCDELRCAGGGNGKNGTWRLALFREGARLFIMIGGKEKNKVAVLA